MGFSRDTFRQLSARLTDEKISNIDTLSTFIDRLITEHIKLFFFQKDGDEIKISKQERIVLEINNKIRILLMESFEFGYEYHEEVRTFENNIIDNINELITNDIHIGESDRQRLKVVMMEEKRLRKSNEGRSKNKNNIDYYFKKFVDLFRGQK